MKILFISDFFQPYAVGAANISTYLIAKKLSENNDCFVVTQSFRKEPWEYGGLMVYPILPNYTHKKRVRDVLVAELVSAFSLRSFFSFYRIIRKFCKEKDIDIINVQSNNLILLSALLLVGKPVVVDVRDYYFTCPFMRKTEKCSKYHMSCLPLNRTKQENWFANLLSTLFFRYQTLVYFIEKNLVFKPLLELKGGRSVFVPNSMYVREELEAEFHPTQIVARVIYNTLNTNDYTRKDKDGKKTVLYASALEKSKGIWECIYAFERFKDNPSVVFEVAGDGPELHNVRRYIAEKGLTNITLLGKVEYKDIPSLYERACITVQPSVWPEPFGRYILESFASVTPLITTPTGGTPEAIKDRETGLLVPPGNSEKIFEAISELLSNTELYKRIRENITEEAKKYSPELIASQRMKLYQGLVGAVQSRQVHQ